MAASEAKARADERSSVINASDYITYRSDYRINILAIARIAKRHAEKNGKTVDDTNNLVDSARLRAESNANNAERDLAKIEAEHNIFIENVTTIGTIWLSTKIYDLHMTYGDVIRSWIEYKTNTAAEEKKVLASIVRAKKFYVSAIKFAQKITTIITNLRDTIRNNMGVSNDTINTWLNNSEIVAHIEDIAREN